jgi:hypothetical protein
MKSANNQMKPWGAKSIHALLVTAFYSMLYVFFFSPVIFSGRLFPNDGFYHLPNFYLGKMFWDPLVLSGFPMAADPSAMTWYPLSWIFSSLGSWNGFVLSAYVLGSSFVYSYVFTLTQSRLASTVSGIIYGMSGFMMAHLGHTSMIHAAVWMPLLIWALEKLHDHFTSQWFAVACVAVACSALSGHPQILVYTLGMGAAYTLVRGLSKGKGSFRYYGSYGVIVAFGLALAAIQLLPSLELARLGLRARMSFAEFISFSLNPFEAIRLVFPCLFGGLPGAFYRLPYFGSWNLVELTGYIGLLPLMLAAIGFIAHRKKSLAWVWFGIGLFAFLLTLGDYTPLARLMYYLPVYNKFRCHARNFIEMGLAVSVLSGLGIIAIQKQMVLRCLILRTIIVGLTVMFAGLIIIFLFSTRLQTIATEKGVGSIKLLPWSNPSVGIPLIIFLLAIISLLFWSRQNHSRFRQLLLLSVLIIDLGSFGWFTEWKYHSPDKNHLTPPASAQRYKPLLENTHQRMVPIRGALGSLDEIPPNLSRLWGVPSASGTGPLILSRVSQILSLLPHGVVIGTWSSPHNKSFDVMAIRYAFLHKDDVNFIPIRGAKGISWSKDDLTISLGSGCGPPQPSSTKINLPAPISATSIGIVSSMACSTQIPDEKEVVRILVTDVHRKTQTIPLLAGRDTSEWAFDCSDVLPLMQHRRAQIFQNFPVVRGALQEKGHRYVAILPVGKTSEIKELEFQWVGPSAIIGIQKISFLDEKTEQSYPLSGVMSDLANLARWRHIENIGDTSVYENLRAMPRVWLVPEVVNLKPEEVLHAIKTSSMPDGRIYDPSQIALVEEPLSFKAKYFDKMASAQIVHLSNTRIEIHTNSASPCFLVLSDVYYPGWKATIDGNPTHIFQTNYVLRGVMVPAGGHIVHFEFRPKSFYWGAGISIISLFSLFGVCSYWYAKKGR